MLLSEKQTSTEGMALAIWHVGSFCIFGWDCLVSLPKEIKYVWRMKFTPISLLYLANRYLGLIQAAVTIWFVGFSCENIFLWQSLIILVCTLLSHILMAWHIHTSYGLSMFSFCILATIMAAEFAIQIYIVTSARLPAPETLLSCVINGPLGCQISYWTMILLFDIVAFVLTLYKASTSWRKEIDIPFITLVFRDGVVYFAAIFSMNLINVALLLTQADDLKAINVPATFMFNIIMSCRLVLNVRKQPTWSQMAEVSVSMPIWNNPAGSTSSLLSAELTVPGISVEKHPNQNYALSRHLPN